MFVGVPPPKTTMTALDGKIVPCGKVCLTEKPSSSVYPDMSRSAPEALYNSTNSSSEPLTDPSPLASPVDVSGSASISLMIRFGSSSSVIVTVC